MRIVAVFAAVVVRNDWTNDMTTSRITVLRTNGVGASTRESIAGWEPEPRSSSFDPGRTARDSTWVAGIERDPLHGTIVWCQAIGIGREVGFDLAVRNQARCELGPSAHPETVERVVSLLRDDRVLRSIFDAAWLAARPRSRRIDATATRSRG